MEMGVYIRLKLLPYEMNQKEWEQVYEESLLLLEAYPFLDLLEDEETHRISWVYVDRAKERPLKQAGGELGWHVFGDEMSLQTAESFQLVRSLEYYRRCGQTHSLGAKRMPAQNLDVLASLMEEEWVREPGAASRATALVFDAKTQGYPYHLYVLAIACLIESRFPRQAVVSGDVTKEQMERAVDWANSVLPRSIRVSERADGSTLLNRVRPLARDELSALKAWMDLSLLDRDEANGEFVRKHFSLDVVARYYLDRFRQHSVGTIGFSSVLREFLNQGNSLSEACRICVLDPAGCRYEAKAFAECALQLGWLEEPGQREDESTRLFALLEPPSGIPETAYSMLGRVILTMLGVREPMRCKVSYENVVETLKQELGHCCDMETVAASQARPAQLKSGGPLLEQLKRMMDELEREAALGYDIEHVEQLIGWTWEDRIHPHIMDKLAQVSAYVTGAGRVECREELERFRQGDHRKRVRMLIASCRYFHIHKQAWDYILGLGNRPEKMELVYLLLSVRAEEFSVHHICKALTNNVGLLRTFILKEELLH